MKAVTHERSPSTLSLHFATGGLKADHRILVYGASGSIGTAAIQLPRTTARTSPPFRRSVARGGTFVETDLGFMWHVPFLALATRFIGSKRVTLPVPEYAKPDVLLIKELIETGQYRAVIDRRYPLDDLVDATKYVATGQKVGNVVITVGEAR